MKISASVSRVNWKLELIGDVMGAMWPAGWIDFKDDHIKVGYPLAPEIRLNYADIVYVDYSQLSVIIRHKKKNCNIIFSGPHTRKILKELDARGVPINKSRYVWLLPVIYFYTFILVFLGLVLAILWSHIAYPLS